MCGGVETGLANCERKQPSRDSAGLHHFDLQGALSRRHNSQCRGRGFESLPFHQQSQALATLKLRGAELAAREPTLSGVLAAAKSQANEWGAVLSRVVRARIQEGQASRDSEGTGLPRKVQVTVARLCELECVTRHRAVSAGL